MKDEKVFKGSVNVPIEEEDWERLGFLRKNYGITKKGFLKMALKKTLKEFVIKTGDEK